ncbi:hypothetical protein Taro_045354 [Colocasia esculenta]|uniref:Guanine nucleotide-binding protein subunit beta-like protein n=1 Tax=Colocasia esculenta TaxID=4460 RepID=A0A843WWU4_COLES|nr:hypothetical protein [Colocasia esculenta]
MHGSASKNDLHEPVAGESVALNPNVGGALHVCVQREDADGIRPLHRGRLLHCLRRPPPPPHRHSHFVQDVVLSSDGQFALSGSWDGELRLWDLSTGTTTRRFVGHSKDVLSVTFNRQIVSASRDHAIRLWNTLGECKYTIQNTDGHTN